MNWLQGLFGREAKSAIGTDGTTEAELRKGGNGQVVTWKSALEVSTVLACVRVISQGVGQVPFRLYQNVLLVPDTSISGQRVTRELDRAITERGMPKTIVPDNGTGFTSAAILKWVQDNGVDWHYIQPGKPTRNAFIESFNGRLRPSHVCKHALPGSG